MSLANCTAEINAAAGKTLSNDELDDLAEELDVRLREAKLDPSLVDKDAA